MLLMRTIFKGDQLFGETLCNYQTFLGVRQLWVKEQKEDKKNLVVHEVKPNRDNKGADEKKNKK